MLNFLRKYLFASKMSLKSAMHQYTIDRVKEKREALNISQGSLSQSLGYADGFVGHCENPKRRDKYNLDHINKLAKFFNCSPRDFVPEKPIE